MDQQGSTTVPSTLARAAVEGTQLTRAQPVFTNKILPTSTGHTLAAQKPQEYHTCPTTMGICRQLLPTAAAVGKPGTLPWREGGVTDNSSGKGTQTCFLSAARDEYTTQHYQKLWVRDKRLFLSDSLEVQPTYRNIWL